MEKLLISVMYICIDRNESIWVRKCVCLWLWRFAMCKCNSTAPAEVLAHTSSAQCFRRMLGAGLEFKLVLNCCFKVCKFRREMRFQQLHMSGLLYYLSLHGLMCNCVFITLLRAQIFSCISQQIEALDLELCILP